VAVVESVKAASDVYAPVTGSIVDINPTAVETPEVVNQDAYAAWLFKMQPAAAGDLDTLLDAATYQQLVDAA
jgi:glycine cleavage system H protein